MLWTEERMGQDAKVWGADVTTLSIRRLDGRDIGVDSCYQPWAGIHGDSDAFGLPI